MLDVALEAALHDDLLIQDAVDGPGNLTIKFITALNYQARGMFCGRGPCVKCQQSLAVSEVKQPDFLLMVDDDYMVSIPNLFRILKNRDPNETVYEGWLLEESPTRSRLSFERVSFPLCFCVH